MRQRFRAVILGCSLGLLLTLCSYGQTSPKELKPSYDGRWWLSISASERTGFLNGYFDCYTYEYKGSDRFSSSAGTYRQSITEFYKKGQPFELNDLVSNLLHEFRDPTGRIVIDKYAEHEAGAHGGDDGLYWRQMSADTGPEVQQRGFVEGYLACHAELNHHKGGTFSKPPGEYVTLIAGWYGFNRETDDINAKREPTAIGNVLFKFRDEAQHSKPGSE